MKYLFILNIKVRRSYRIMEISFNYGVRRYLISNNYIYFPLFIFFFIFFLKQKQKRNKTSLNLRGGDNKLILQKFYDQCLSDDLYLQVTNSRVKQIIRRMLNIPANETIIISASVYLLAILKTKHAPLILQRGGTQLIVSNFRGFLSKGVGTILFAKLLAVGSGAIIIASLPLILTALVYSHLHVDCNSFVDTLPTIQGSLQYIETPINDDALIIVAPPKSKPLYVEVDETKVSLSTSLKCYIRNNCLGPESIQKNNKLKTKRWVPLSQRTKTLKDVQSDIDKTDAIDVNSVKYKQEN